MKVLPQQVCSVCDDHPAMMCSPVPLLLLALTSALAAPAMYDDYTVSLL